MPLWRCVGEGEGPSRGTRGRLEPKRNVCVCVFLIGVKRGSLGGTPAWGKTLHVWNVFEGFNA